MIVPAPAVPVRGAFSPLSPNVAALGWVSMLTALSSAMIYGLLPVYLVRVLGLSVVSIGLIEGMAEAANSLVKIVSGGVSDRMGRRKPLVVLGYLVSALVKTVFPLAGSASTIVAARIIDRLGKGIRDAPRDAFVADVTAADRRGSSFGLRLALAFSGFVAGPLIAMGLMTLSGDNFRLVFWVALIPAYLSIALLLVAVKELPGDGNGLPIHPRNISALPRAFWWTILVASLLSLARFSPAFLVLKAHEIGVDAAFVPAILVVMYLMYSATAYPFGMLADQMSRRLQFGIGAFILVCADMVLAFGGTVLWTALGAALWGLQLGITQGLLGATIADIATERLRGTAFGIYDVAAGVTAFVASFGAGVLWVIGGPPVAFVAGAVVAASAGFLLLLFPLSVISPDGECQANQVDTP
jgi:MFS family permease